MNKILLIIQREYLTRVKKKSFIVMTIVGPLLICGIAFAQFWLKMIPEEKQEIEVVDESGLFHNKIENSKNMHFDYNGNDLEVVKKGFYSSNYNVIVYIPGNILQSQTVQLFYKKQPGLNTQDYIETTIKMKLEDMKLIASGINKESLEATKTKMTLTSTKLEASGKIKAKDSELTMVLGFLAGILIYMFIFLYGTQVMRGVIEEKTSRIVEVIISSVKPFQLMMGKIIGIALVGLTQFLLWIILGFAGTTMVTSYFMKDKKDTVAIEQTFKTNSAINTQNTVAFKEMNKNDKAEIMDSFFSNINLPVMIISFIFYFLGGYLLYGAMFAAVGSAVDSESDTQQFMMPLTIPLIFAFVMAQNVMTNPESNLAVWLSMIPFTSPIIMMVRIPFGVPYSQLFLSISILIASFIFVTYLSGRIYRTGILMYGKKNSYKELWKWLFYKA